MIKPLRQRHSQVWIILAVVLPAGIVFSWLAIPNHVPVKLLQPSTTELLPVIKHTMDKKEYCIKVRTNKENSEWQLEWKNKLALAVPSAVIYNASPEFHSQPSPAPLAGSVASEGGTSRPFIPDHSQLIGRIEARGDYIFSLTPDSSGYDKLQLVLYDFIHQQTIDSINFQP